jgi:hypothetical protein
MKKQFKDISVDEKFKLNDVEYTKINAVKISCCKSINAQQVADPNNRTFVQPLTEVDVDDQL